MTPKNRAQNPNGVVVYVLRSIQDLPQGLVDTLTTEEANQLLLDFIQAWRTFNALEVFRDHPLAKGAAVDITQSSRYGVVGPDSFGQSRWSSLQAAEKSLKLFLDLNSQRYPKTHGLYQLASLCVGLGLKAIDRSIIAAAQCSDDVRYTFIDKDASRVAAANSAAMKIAYIAATNAPGGKPQPVPDLRVWPTC